MCDDDVSTTLFDTTKTNFPRDILRFRLGRALSMCPVRNHDVM